MAQVTIKAIFRDPIKTQYGERESVKIIPEEDTVVDINGDEIDMRLDDDRKKKISGFRDKNGETDQWKTGTKVKIQVTTKKGKGRDGDDMEWVNFRLPQDQSSIVSQPDDDGVVSGNAEDPDDF